MPLIARRARRLCRGHRKASAKRRKDGVKDPCVRVRHAMVLVVCLQGPCVTAQGLTLGPIDVGGAVRANLLNKSWETRKRFPRDALEFDTLRLRLDFEQDQWEGSSQYRFYYYDETDRYTHFLHHAWVGYRLAPGRTLRAGVHQVPFGNLPYNSHSYFFSLAYYVGLEDDYDLGIKYTDRRGLWRFDLAWYLEDEGSGYGDSRDSARYSYDVVKSATSANGEENQLNARASYTLAHGEHGASQVGVSLQAGEVPNDATGRTGSQVAAALHWNGDFGPWNLKVQSAWYRYNLENPPGQADTAVVMGAYDFPYRVAAEGTLHSVGISYHWDVDWGTVTGITAYEDYSVLRKAGADFEDSMQNVVGVSVDAAPLFIYADIALGQHNAWIGRDFGTALASGGDDDLHVRVNLNIGAYF